MSNTNESSKYSMVMASRLLCLILILILVYFLQSVLVPLLFSMLIAISLFPIARFLERWHIPRAIASLLAVILAILVFSGLIYLIVNQVLNIGRNGDDMLARAQSVLSTIMDWGHAQFGITENMVSEKVQEFTDNALSNASRYIQTAFSSIGGVLASVVLVPLFVFFMLYYRDFFREFFFRAFHDIEHVKVDEVLSNIYKAIQGYLVGLVTVMGIVAILNTIGLLVMGIQYAWFFGILAALLMLIPYIGIAIGSILPALFAIATKDSIWYSLGVIIWFQIVQFLEGNLITPNIVGSKVSINPLMAVVGLLLGGLLFGLAGLILALPLVAILKVLFDAMPAQKHFGFLIGEPEKYHLKRETEFTFMKRMHLQNLLKKKKRKKKDEDSEPEA